MSKKLKDIQAKIEKSPDIYFNVRVYRPFITATIVDSSGVEHGIGTSCVQRPDKWDPALGARAAKKRAVKNMLGISNPRVDYLLEHWAPYN